ncbi:proton-coupled zinc antiporter SLC30A9, mitochondrial isoform X2 [Heptranchias perlo]|uniref:proton-coupled zinc antiporter SLC30A9, mitochondrial isoform X2 n=1 Tax=Heptranchias perlo TaxID=212740 RepID=UPI0035596DFC
MFLGLAQKPWHTLCKFSLRHYAFGVSQAHYVYKSTVTNRSLWHSTRSNLPISTVAQLRLCSSYGKKNGTSDSSASSISASSVEESSTQQNPKRSAQGSIALGQPTLEQIQVKVKAILKKRDYGSTYTQNNFITGMRALNEFCLKPSDLELLRKITRRSPHDDTEIFTVYLRSDVEAKALEVHGSPEALARAKKQRKKEEITYKENVFKNQKLMREYREFLGNTMPRSTKSTPFLQGPGKVVMVAICINGLNFIFKLLAWVHTGSASMFSEAIHSLADTCNQAYFILAGSLVSEGATLLVAINELRKSARARGITFCQYVMHGHDPTTNVVLLEDAAAVIGVLLAASCMGLTSLTGNTYFDSIGSLGVGALLSIVSTFLIYTNTEALIGRSIQPENVQRLTELLENDPSVRAVHDVKATDMGMSTVRFKAEVDFDGRIVTRSYLEKQDIDVILNEIQQVKTPEDLEAFMLKHGENIIDTLGAEVDRLEVALKQKYPDVRHVDLEIL